MSEQIEKTYEDVKDLAKDFFGIGDSEADTLMKLAKLCAVTSGIPVAGAGAIALSSVSSVTIPLVGAVPGYVGGALAGFVGGTTACMITRRSITDHIKQILGKNGTTPQQFRSDVRKIISIAHGKAGYCSNAA